VTTENYDPYDPYECRVQYFDEARRCVMRRDVTGDWAEYDERFHCFVRRDDAGERLCLGKFGELCTNYPLDDRVLCRRCLRIHQAWHRASHDWGLPRRTLEEVYLRSGACCEDCGGDGPHLEMHHIRYTVVTVPRAYERYPYSVRGRETVHDLDLLCRDCHQHRHISPLGGYEADPQTLIARWPGYYDERGRRRGALHGASASGIE
jgi:hypothetical protein